MITGAGPRPRTEDKRIRRAENHAPGLTLIKFNSIARGRGILRYSGWDALLIAMALLHAAALVAAPSAPAIALGLWWNSNTISHNFIHKPFFRQAVLNRFFSFYLSALLGFPQSVWRDRHLAHHAGITEHKRASRQAVLEMFLVCVVWAALLAVHPLFFLTVYMPGYFAGIGLCYLQGYYEHAQGATSHYGAIYNTLFFNDGYHMEHHADPAMHWRQLPGHRNDKAKTSRWPAVLRWLDAINLESLERLVLCSKLLQRFVLRTHERAFRKLLPELGSVGRVAIVGGGIFPRTAMIFKQLFPEAELVIIDAKAESIQAARSFVRGNINFVNAWYAPTHHDGFDLVVIPLSFIGDRASIYRHPAAPAVLIHDWIWRPHGISCIVSVLLLKRLNLVKRCEQ
jgi:hypothetical protein